MVCVYEKINRINYIINIRYRFLKRINPVFVFNRDYLVVCLGCVARYFNVLKDTHRSRFAYYWSKSGSNRDEDSIVDKGWTVQISDHLLHN